MAEAWIMAGFMRMQFQSKCNQAAGFTFTSYISKILG